MNEARYTADEWRKMEHDKSTLTAIDRAVTGRRIEDVALFKRIVLEVLIPVTNPDIQRYVFLMLRELGVERQ